MAHSLAILYYNTFANTVLFMYSPVEYMYMLFLIYTFMHIASNTLEVAYTFILPVTLLRWLFVDFHIFITLSQFILYVVVMRNITTYTYTITYDRTYHIITRMSVLVYSMIALTRCCL